MTRALSTRSSKRKQAVSSQEVVPRDCKENSPSILSQPKNRKLKQNLAPSGKSKFTSTIDVKENVSPITNCVKSKNSSVIKSDITAQTQLEKRVLCDRTNSKFIERPRKNSFYCDVLKTTENKENLLHKLITVPILNDVSNPYKEIKENHVPIYRSQGCRSILSDEHSHSELDEAVYEFKFDEKEEPAKKKKRKKKVNTKKPRIGAKALTINNIKYSSTESLVSLPERPHTRKKKITNMTTRRKSDLRETNGDKNRKNTCHSVNSFSSHPLSAPSGNIKTHNSRHNLSVLLETQSEQCQSPVCNVNTDSSITPKQALNNNACSTHSASYVKSNSLSINSPKTMSQYQSSKCFPQLKTSQNNCLTENQQSSISGNKMASPCSWKNTQHISSINNYSPASTNDFVSSTPVKRASLVVQDNSVFDETIDELPGRLRPSTGFIRSYPQESNAIDNLFGFDESEQLEEPLVSPIKCNLNQAQKRQNEEPGKLVVNTVAKSQPSVQQVIEMLKASIPKRAQQKEMPEMLGSSLENSVSPNSGDDETPVHFNKPLRRSYERQRHVHYHREEEDEKEEGEEDNKETEQTDRQEPQALPEKNKRIYIHSKRNITKTAKTTKAQQKATKEEEELDRFAAQMNAQFEAIEKVDLVVE